MDGDSELSMFNKDTNVPDSIATTPATVQDDRTNGNEKPNHITVVNMGVQYEN
jgi:hypothetical protein